MNFVRKKNKDLVGIHPVPIIVTLQMGIPHTRILEIREQETQNQFDALHIAGRSIKCFYY